MMHGDKNIQRIKIHNKELSMVMHSFNPSAWEAEESGYLCVLDQPNLHKSFPTVRPPQGPYLKQRKKKNQTNQNRKTMTMIIQKSRKIKLRLRCSKIVLAFGESDKIGICFRVHKVVMI